MSYPATVKPTRAPAQRCCCTCCASAAAACPKQLQKPLHCTLAMHGPALAHQALGRFPCSSVVPINKPCVAGDCGLVCPGRQSTVAAVIQLPAAWSSAPRSKCPAHLPPIIDSSFYMTADAESPCIDCTWGPLQHQPPSAAAASRRSKHSFSILVHLALSGACHRAGLHDGLHTSNTEAST